MFAGPLHAEIHAVTVLHFRNDGFHQHLRTTNIQLVDHLLQRVHDVWLSGDHQRVGGLIGGDIQLAIGCRGFAFRGTGFVFQLLTNTGQHRHHFRGVGVFQVEDAGIALVVLFAVELANQRAGTRAGIFGTADHQAVGFIIGHHFGRQLWRVLPFLLFIVEVVQHIGELFRRGIAQRYDFATLHTGTVHALNQIHQAVHHRGFPG